MYHDPTGHMNYLTQTHLLIGGYLERGYEISRQISNSYNVGDIINGAKQGIAFWKSVGSVAKSMYDGSMSWADLAELLGDKVTDALIGDLLYLKDNYTQFSTDVDITNDQAWELGRRITGAITQAAALGMSFSELATAVKNFSTRKIISLKNIKLNPKDDILKRGYNNESLSFQREYIKNNGDISRAEPFVVYDLGDGSYMLQNGHHRLKAAQQMGLKQIRVDQIIKLTAEQISKMLGGN